MWPRRARAGGRGPRRPRPGGSGSAGSRRSESASDRWHAAADREAASEDRRLKEVNDRQGHAAGDALLRDVAAAVLTHLRSYDELVRVGGDEFVCALGLHAPICYQSL
jgi:Diguanylate cyclase, GGDEF domain